VRLSIFSIPCRRRAHREAAASTGSSLRALVVVAYNASSGGFNARVYSAAKDYDRSLHELVGILCIDSIIVARIRFGSEDRQCAEMDATVSQRDRRLARWSNT
jgi:hypothetical protein